MSDRSFGQGLLDNEEKTLVRDLVLWAKSGGRMAQAAAGTSYDADLRFKGPEQGEAAWIRIMVMGVQQDQPLNDRLMTVSLKAGKEVVLPFRYELPPGIPPGIYHVEYTLLDERKRPLTQPVESGDGWFTVLQ
jgi:hypothetical protein